MCLILNDVSTRCSRDSRLARERGEVKRFEHAWRMFIHCFLCLAKYSCLKRATNLSKTYLTLSDVSTRFSRDSRLARGRRRIEGSEEV